MDKAETTIRAVELIEAAVGAEGFKEFSEGILPLAAGLAQTPAGFLYVADPRLHAPHFAGYGLTAEELVSVETACPEWFDAVEDELGSSDAALRVGSADPPFVVHPLPVDGRVLGMIGLRGGGPLAADPQSVHARGDAADA